MAERDQKRAQADLEITTKIIQTTEGEVSKYKMDCQTNHAKIKNLKEKLKGNISLIQAKDIIWNDIIAEMKTIWDFLTIVVEEKSIIKEFEEQVITEKKKIINRAIWARNCINFIDSKKYQELEENEIKDKILYVVEINKMIVKNDCRKSTEKKLIELKGAVNQFDKLFDK